MASINVVKSLRTKDASGFSSPSFIGTEQFLVAALRGSSNNNLEEQLLIGSDCIITSWTEDDGTKRVTKEFRNENIDKNYYILEEYDYDVSSGEDQYIGYVGGVMSLKLNNTDATVDNNELAISNNQTYNFTEDKEKININPTAITTNKMELFFQSDTTKIPVSEKVTQQSYSNDGRIVKREIITNILNS